MLRAQGVHVARLAVSLGAASLLMVARPATVLAGPARLHVEVGDSSVKVGNSTRVLLVFL